MFAGASYTLNCTVMSDLRSVVKWTGLDGNPVYNTSSITVDAPVYDGIKTYVLLRFPALHTSQAGRYTCVSILSSPLSVRTAIKDVVVTGKKHCRYYTGTMVASYIQSSYIVVCKRHPVQRIFFWLFNSLHERVATRPCRLSNKPEKPNWNIKCYLRVLRINLKLSDNLSKKLVHLN